MRCLPDCLPACLGAATICQPVSQTPPQPIFNQTGMLPPSLYCLYRLMSLRSLWRRVAVGPSAHAVPPVGGTADARQPESPGIHAGGLGGAASRQQQVSLSFLLL